MKRGLVMLSACVLAALSIVPVQAKQAAIDPGAQVCELDWQASFGKVELKQTWSGAGEMTREDLRIRRDFPADGSRGGGLALSQSIFRGVGSDHTSRLIYLSLGASIGKDKHQRLVLAVPGGGPLVIAAENGGLLIPVSEVQLTRLLEAKERVTYRLITVDSKGAEKKFLAEGWLDLSGFAEQPLAGLAEAADRARAAMALARGGDKPPCVMAYAAEMNTMDSDEATRRWLSFDCREGWDGPLGAFELRETGFSWRPGPRDSVSVTFAGTFRPAPSAARQHFLLGPNDPQRFGQISVMFGAQDWGANYRSSDPALRERQSGELRRGSYVARHWLSQNGSVGFFWSEFAQMLAGEGDLKILAHDKVTGAALRGTVPWADVLAAEEELRAGQRRLIAREREPMTRCKAVVDEELGTEQIIVT